MSEPNHYANAAFTSWGIAIGYASNFVPETNLWALSGGLFACAVAYLAVALHWHKQVWRDYALPTLTLTLAAITPLTRTPFSPIWAIVFVTLGCIGMILNIRNGRKPRKPSPPTTKNSDDLEKKVKDVVKVEGSIIAFSLLALGLVLNAISTYDQLNFALAQVPGGRFFGFIPLGPIMQTFTVIVLFDVACLSTGLVSRIAPGKHYDLKYGLIVFSVCSLVIGLVLFTWAVWSLRLAFFY